MDSKIRHSGTGDAERPSSHREETKPKKEHPPSSSPRDRGDVKRNKKGSKHESLKRCKHKKAKCKKIPAGLVSTSTNTSYTPKELSTPAYSSNSEDFSPRPESRTWSDYRQRVRNTYTIYHPYTLNETNISKYMDVKNDQRKPLRLDSAGERILKESNDFKKQVKRLCDCINKAVSTMTIKPTIKTPALEEEDKIKKRKAVIKTVTSKADTVRAYKAVTFVDEKHVPRKTLQIKIPNKNVPKLKAPGKSKIPRLISVPAVSNKNARVSQTSVKRRPADGAKKLLQNSSPAKSANSLPTEVAQWAPYSTNQYTIPYYEAWVNKTLTAVSKYSKKDQAYLEKCKVLYGLKELRKRTTSPELRYSKIDDEQCAGRIRVRQRPKRDGTM